MKTSSSVVAIAIPLLAIAFALFYFHETSDYPDSESVKFPYTLAIAVIALFAVAAMQEAAGRWRRGWRFPSFSEFQEAAASLFRGKNSNPFFIVVLTLAYTVFLPIVYALLATFLFVVGLRCVFRNVRIKILAYDAAAIVVIFVLFHDVLRIQLPSGPLEEMLSRAIRMIF